MSTTDLRKIPASATFALAKTLHHIAAAKFYTELTIVEAQAKFGAKQFLSDQARNLERIITNMKLRVASSEVVEAIRTELQDPIMIDALTDAIIALQPEGREKVSTLINELLDAQHKNNNAATNTATNAADGTTVDGTTSVANTGCVTVD